ncbi:MAG: sulfatase-like hydrolase/transferase [Caldilineaceae bacterium]|nr:sulfatase-like hydrolase/transferase [Caldilineaceae bacterium]
MPTSRPNILIFFTDDQRFDTIRALGNDAIHTPNMDRLVARGTTFCKGYIPGGSSGAVCMPSRAMLMTGRYLYRLEGEGQGIPAEHLMLPEYLRGQGYTTFGTGKWHNGPAAFARCFSDGGEIFFGGMDDHWNVPACHFDPTGRYPDTRPHPIDFGPTQPIIQKRWDHITPGKHSSELFAETAIDFLRGHTSDDPFLLYVAFMAPHDPRTMPAEYRGMYDPEAIDLPENFLLEHPFDNGDLYTRDELLAAHPRNPAEIRRHLADYYGMISHLDAQIGRVLDALEESGHGEDTLIVFAGDNGLALGRHGLMGKQNLYDHSVHVPLIFAGPGVPAGQQTDARAFLLDIYPTLCDLLGLPTPPSVDGQSLVPAIHSDGPGRDSLYFAYQDIQRALLGERYKLIEYCTGEERHTQLFDTQADPLEMHDLSGLPEYASELASLRQAMQRARLVHNDVQEQGQRFWARYENSHG